MSQRSGASRSSGRPRNLYRFVDMVEGSEETEPTMDSQQPPQQEEEEESEPMEDPSIGSQPGRLSPPPPPAAPAPRAPPPPRQNVEISVSDGGPSAPDPYLHPRLPRHHPHHFGPRLGEGLPRPVFGVPPPPPLGMTGEERDRVWGIANGLRDARSRVRTQEVMMERAFGIIRQTAYEAGTAVDEVHRINNTIFWMGCVLTALCAFVVVLVLRK